MIVVTTNDIVGKNVLEVKGLVEGSVVKTRHVGRDIGAGLKTLVGGEIKGYSELMNSARTEARARMIQEANQLGANAILGLRYQTAQVMNSAAEIVAYGTAVIID